jgi:hypothetical protein
MLDDKRQRSKIVADRRVDSLRGGFSAAFFISGGPFFQRFIASCAQVGSALMFTSIPFRMSVYEIACKY